MSDILYFSVSKKYATTNFFAASYVYIYYVYATTCQRKISCETLWGHKSHTNFLSVDVHQVMNVFLFSIFDYFKHEKSRTIVEKMEVFYYYFPDLLLPYLLFVQNWYCQGFSNSEIVHRCKFCTILNSSCMGIHIGSTYKKVTCLCYQFLPHRKFKGHTNSQHIILLQKV